MKDKNAESKLDNQLATDQMDQTGKSNNSASQTARPRFKIKFTDYAIERFMPSFMVEGKQREIVDTPFDVSKNTVLKGLKLRVGYKTKNI